MRHKQETSAILTAKSVYRPRNPSSGGWVEVNSSLGERFADLGLDSPSCFLDLPGEVVSGHPDRHVVRVMLPGFSSAFYLKRQHRVTRREKWRNWLAGFGWVSRSEREWSILKQLTLAGLPCPTWAAVGVDDRSRAFLLVEELPGAVDLRQLLIDTRLSQSGRSEFAKRLGRLIAQYHMAGFTTPELCAKHVLISPNDNDIRLIDWQSARRQRAGGSHLELMRNLASLHASLPETRTSPREKLNVLAAASRQHRPLHWEPHRFGTIARCILGLAEKQKNRRSIRDQRQSTHAVQQRLVWVAGEAVCAVPDIAASWPQPAITAPYYGCEPGTLPILLPDGRAAVLIRGKACAPVGRFNAWIRGRSWRSPGATLGRLLFHLERYGIPAPRLLAFGQRLTGPVTAEWFALHTGGASPLPKLLDHVKAEQLGGLLRQLHEAGCSVGKTLLQIFGIDDRGLCVRDLTAIRIARCEARRELEQLLDALSPWVRKAALAGYRLVREPAKLEVKVTGSTTADRLTLVDVNR